MESQLRTREGDGGGGRKPIKHRRDLDKVNTFDIQHQTHTLDTPQLKYNTHEYE
jgi:hypothetical protein